MTDTLEQDHAQVALSALGANGNIARVFDGFIPDPTPDPPYVLVYTRVDWPRDGMGTALSAVQNTITTTFTCHSVSMSVAGARAVQMQVRSTLLNLRPVIAGRNCSPIKQDDSQDPDRDESLGHLVMDAISIFSFTSTG